MRLLLTIIEGLPKSTEKDCVNQDPTMSHSPAAKEKNMKRKLNEEDTPAPTDTTTQYDIQRNPGFGALGLDARLLQAVAKQNFSTPTAVQAKAIPLALAGIDILARSQTGSGKTAAYVLPILQSILHRKAVGYLAT